MDKQDSGNSNTMASAYATSYLLERTMASFGRVHEHALAPVRGAPPISVIIYSFPSGAESFEECGNALSGHTRCTAEAYLIVALCARMKSRLAP